jgi:hypothetical protein
VETISQSRKQELLSINSNKRWQRKDKCYNCFNLSNCTGFIQGKVCDVIKNSERLMALYKDYKDEAKKARKPRSHI